jgi:hypothetical protein
MILDEGLEAMSRQPAPDARRRGLAALTRLRLDLAPQAAPFVDRDAA